MEQLNGFSRHFRLAGATGPLIGLLLLCLFLSVATDSFFSVRNFLNILDQITVIGIIAIGMTFVILIGGIDLSVGSLLALAMMVLGYLNVEAGLSMAIAIPGGIVAAGLAGAVSGILITKFRVPAFIATLAMMSIARGLASMITDGSQIIGFPPWFNMGAIIRYGGVITMTVAVMFFVFTLAWVFQKYRAEGRALYAIGGNPEVARLAGINVERLTIGVYTACGVLSGVAGVLLAACNLA